MYCHFRTHDRPGAFPHGLDERLVTRHAAPEDDTMAAELFCRTRGFCRQRFAESVLETAGEMGAVGVQCSAKFGIAHRVQQRRFEAAERHIVVVVVAGPLAAVEHRPRETEACRITLAGKRFDMPAAGIRQPHQLRDLIEGFAGGVVAGRAEQPIFAPRGDVEQQRVTAAHEKGGERRIGRRVFECRREEMAFHVMHADQRQATRGGERFRETHTHKERADKARGVRHGDRVDVVEGNVRVSERLPHHRRDCREMGPRRDLRHDAAENPVHVLREDHE